MADDKNKLDYKDRSRINQNEKYEMRYWSEKFGVTERKLKEAVLRVGPMVKDVEEFLKK